MKNFEDQFVNMEIPAIVERLRDIPYIKGKRTPNPLGFDCAGFAGCLVPKLGNKIRKKEIFFVKTIIGSLKGLKYECNQFKKLREPKDRDIVIMSKDRGSFAPEHMGVFYKGKVIHHTERGIFVEDLSLIKYLYANVQFLRVL